MKEHKDNQGRYRTLLAVSFWLMLFLVLLSQRDKLTVENIVSFSPKNIFLAVMVLLALYAVKGISMLINGYILYIAAGIMFSTPLALAINFFGSLIMISIPYLMGRKGGAATVEKLSAKYKKLETLRDKPKQNEYLSSFFLRILGVLPCEIVSMFLGACELHYGKYLMGSMAGLLPSIVATTIMGQYASTPGSPQFVIAATIWGLGVVTGVVLSYVDKKKKQSV